MEQQQGAIHGQCLCGAVRIEVRDFRAEVGVCHCDMCRRWTGSTYAFFTAPRASVEVAGPLKWHRSSSFSQRGFCPICGSSLMLQEDGLETVELCAGAFGAARDFPLISEAYVDRHLGALRLEGDHRRVSAADYEEKNPHVADGGVQ